MKTYVSMGACMWLTCVMNIHLQQTKKHSNTQYSPVAICIIERDILRDRKKVIFIRHIATRYCFDGYGYASKLLKSLGGQYPDQPREVYTACPVVENFLYPELQHVSHLSTSNAAHWNKQLTRTSASKFLLAQGFEKLDGDWTFGTKNRDGSRGEYLLPLNT